MKKGTIGRLFFVLVWIAEAVAAGMIAVSVYRLNMLPEAHFLMLAAGLLLFWVISGLLMFLPGSKRGTVRSRQIRRFVRRSIGLVLAVSMTALCAMGSFAVAQVQSAVDGITGAAQTVNVSMSVYVRADDPAHSIADAANYHFAVMEDYEAIRTAQAVEQIRNELGGEIRLSKTAALTDLVEQLYNGEVQAVILNSAFVSLLEDTEEFADFSQQTRVLYSAVIEETVYKPTEPSQPETSASTEATAPTEEENLTITGSPFVMYVSGSDTQDYYLTTSRSDVNILMVVNPQTKMVLLINTPRDYYVSNPAGNGAGDKLTHCGIYGIACSVGALEDLYGTEIRYYSQINFTGLKTMVDAIGGVDVYSEYGFQAHGRHWIDEGWNHLNGEQALAFARDRYSHAEGDHARGRNQMKVIKAVINQVTSGTTIIENYAAILESIQGMFRTNVTTEEIGDLVKMQLGDMASWTIVSYSVTGTGGSDITYSIPGMYCYVMYPDQDMVSYGQELIRRVFDGEILTDADMTCPY